MATTTTNYSFNLPAVGGDDDAWGTLLNANWTSIDAIFSGTGTDINIDGYTASGMTLTGVVSLGIAGGITETVYAAGASGTVNISAANGTVQTITMTGNVSITNGLTDGQFVTLKIASVGTDTVTWPAGIKWMFGAEPTLDATNPNWVQLWVEGGILYASYIGYTA